MMLLALYKRLSPKRYHAALKHLDLAFGNSKTSQEKKAILSEALLNFLRFPFEWFHSFFWNHQEYLDMVYCSEESKRNLESAINQNKGVIIMSSHLGNWEVCARFFEECYPNRNAMVTKPLKPAWLNKWVCQHREACGTKVIYKVGALRAVITALKEKKNICILMDQNRPDGIFVPFFGRLAKTSPMIASLAIRLNVPICSVASVRRESGYELVVSPALAYTLQGDKNEQLHHLTELCNRALEKQIFQYPEQYLWTHLRYRSLHEGQQSLYE